jgi:spermidine synthase
MEQISYTERASFYEVEQRTNEDHSFLKSLVTSNVKSILEIPAGSGRNLRWLSKTRRRVVFADKEPSMVQHIKQRFNDLRFCNQLTVVIADMRRFNLKEKFDLILVPQESFQLIVNDSEALSALTCLGQHLTNNGTLMIALANFSQSQNNFSHKSPKYFDPQIMDGVKIYEWTRRLAKDKSLSRWRIQYHHHNYLTIQFQYRLKETDQPTKSFYTDVQLKYYDLQTFLKLTQLSGLRIGKAYSNYDFEEYKNGDPRMIFLVERI